jgi:hypothetical protein
MAKVSGRRRNYLCTIHIRNLECPYGDIPDWTLCDFVDKVLFQLERGQKTQKLHWQVFLELDNSYPFSLLQSYFPVLCCSLKDQLGHPVAGRNYVHKETTRVGSETYCYAKGFGYLTTCTHKSSESHGCSGAPPLVMLIPKHRPLPKGLNESQELRFLLDQKLNEMKAWQAYVDKIPYMWV